jgi:hypothetical protein
MFHGQPIRDTTQRLGANMTNTETARPTEDDTAHNIHPDYRTVVNGVRMILVWDAEVGTVLRPEVVS